MKQKENGATQKIEFLVCWSSFSIIYLSSLNDTLSTNNQYVTDPLFLLDRIYSKRNIKDKTLTEIEGINLTFRYIDIMSINNPYFADVIPLLDTKEPTETALDT
jgi:hypothetical protein